MYTMFQYLQRVEGTITNTYLSMVILSKAMES
jgi:hypothetical protein